jgi:hypothetical protein
MKKRHSKRIKVKLNAERISGNEKYGVFIENISEKGIHIITTHLKTHKEYAPGTDIDLKFRLSSGETLNLYCKVRWAYSEGPTDSIGMEILDPPLQYIEFVQSLH